MRQVVLVLFTLSVSTVFSITPEECEDGEFHLDPDNCPYSYFRCYVKPNGAGWRIEQYTCPTGTGFHPGINTCDWLYNLPPNICDGITHRPTDAPTTRPPPVSTTEPTTVTTTEATTITTTQSTTVTTTEPTGAKRVVCYFGAWAFYRPGEASFDIDDIDPHLCTHLCYGFANMDNQTWEAVAYDPWYDLAPWDEGCEGDHCHYDSYRRFNKLKEQNPALKTLLSIGGWNTGSGQWSQMAIDPAKRKTFIGSAVLLAKTFGFSGIDFDWEYPGDRAGSDVEHDKEDFTMLVEEFADACHADGLILTAATSPDFKRLDIGMDIPRVAAALDFMNVMTYDYHGAWDNFTGLNTPLYGRIDEEDPDHPGYRFNVNDSINYYIAQGADPMKLNLGTAAYGRGFTLPDDSDTVGLYCPAYEGIPGGHNTHEPGMWSYYEILEALNNDTLPDLPDDSDTVGLYCPAYE